MMETNYEKSGIYLSRAYYDWLIEKNDELTDKYVTFGELFKAYSNSRYKRFIQEQNVIENDFFYHIQRIDNYIVLNRSYDLVFVPYDKILTGYGAKTDIESTDDFVVSYSNLCQDGRYPGTCTALHYGYISKYLHSDYIAYDSFTEERKRYEKMMEAQDYTNMLGLSYVEYAMAEEDSSGLLGCDFERMLTKRIEANVIRHLMDEAENLYLVSRRKKYYELRLLEFVEGIILLSTHGYKVGQMIPISRIQEHVREGIKTLEKKDVRLTVPEMCKEIRDARKDTITLSVSDQLTGDKDDDDYDD